LRSSACSTAQAAGVTAAVADAAFHAMGRRIRKLPITPEKLV
jgi:CO/xanthine dehydrogenase Mo-binding subunit